MAGSALDRVETDKPYEALAVTGKAEASAGSPIIELAQLTKTFDSSGQKVVAIEGVDLAVRPGEFVTLVGPSGCGKSTLFNIVSGLLDADTGGKIHFKGEERQGKELLGTVSFMPQRDLLLPWRRVIDNAVIALEVEGMRRKEAREKAQVMFQEFGLAGFERHYPHQLSGGMRQRVALMRTFLFERDLMLLDEPFGALDALTRVMMQRWLLGIWQRHRRSILFITHDVDEAIFLGDRVVVMTARPGRIKLSREIDLPRPRDPHVTTTPEFLAIKADLMEAIEEESMKSFMSQDERG
ncbi:ABC transporter ATP-binding protein [Oceanibacterium hippocampi]|uniref:Aliphatic sulfonates import ATP-binding protein SsuB n=1 Tax=Oceanibacterium hippocampi TaxID=745714 RepID=A0A1Y5TWN0_9PROT|nr:ABC transporter ATP-binding protein [Oceanibacterium hippocampi]SLN75499.1 Aliphatic sulfonates import ATP-binding protein SsuB [Oceanibacterium hippocampi]